MTQVGWIAVPRPIDFDVDVVGDFFYEIGAWDN